MYSSTRLLFADFVLPGIQNIVPSSLKEREVLIAPCWRFLHLRENCALWVFLQRRQRTMLFCDEDNNSSELNRRDITQEHFVYYVVIRSGM